MFTSRVAEQVLGAAPLAEGPGPVPRGSFGAVGAVVGGIVCVGFFLGVVCGSCLGLVKVLERFRMVLLGFRVHRVLCG